MVQFKTNAWRDIDDYWKLESYDTRYIRVRDLKERLDEQGHYYKSSANKTRLRSLLIRCDIGLLSYGGCTLRELKEFVIRRRLDFPTNTKKDELISMLEDADEERTFDQVLSLPPELRNQIYTLHFEDFGICDAPTSPPIARASRQLRQESLILFYRTCITQLCFMIWIPHFYSRIHTPDTRLLKTDPLRPHDNTKRLFSRVPEDILGNMRKFSLNGYVFGPDMSEPTTWRVDLAQKGGQGLLSSGSVERRAPGRDYAAQDAAREKLENRMRVELGEIATRDGDKKLRRDDLEIFRRMFIVKDSDEGGK